MVVRSDARLCARPECGRAATSSLTYHYASSAVWMDPLPSEREPSHYDLCDLHAARVQVPHGWRLVDRRGAHAP
ncbi:MAG: DUF3499 family protein [Actinobacteria bacterium]|nr:DUF3499 family protein [Actinomycetota bacterium]